MLSTSGQELTDLIPSDIWELHRRDSNIYGIPLMGTLFRQRKALVLHKAQFDQYPNKEELLITLSEANYMSAIVYEQIDDYLRYLKREDMLGSGISNRTFEGILDIGLETIYGNDTPFVIRIEDERPTVHNKYELEPYRTYYEYMYKWYEDGYITESLERMADSYSQDGKEEGSAIFVDEYDVDGIGDGRVLCDYEEIRLPITSELYMNYDMVRNSLVIPKNAKHPDRAIDVINLLHSDDGNVLFNLLIDGVEGGAHYYHKDGYILKHSDGSSKLDYSLSSHSIGNRFIGNQYSSGQFEMIKSLNDKTKLSSLIGFELDTRMSIVDMTKVTLIARNHFMKINEGDSGEWEKDYDSFIKKMNDAGAKEILIELQRQLDAFVKSK